MTATGALSTMNLTIQPPASSWRITIAGDAQSRAVRSALLSASSLDRPVIATGHQPWLWHPGILAKDIAMSAAAHRLAAATFHLAVDHDDHPATTIELPVVRENRLTIETLSLGHENVGLPAVLRPAIDAQAARKELISARDRLGSTLPTDLGPLIDAFADNPQASSLGEQIARITEQLMRPYVGATPLVLSSRLSALPAFTALIDRMLHDAPRCAACYNEAVVDHADARMAPLKVTNNQVELPLWTISRGRGRQTVFAQLNAAKPQLATENGSPITDDPAQTLAPKALLMTAFLRRYACDLFIHGKGGGIYDRVMESWWLAWTGEPLSPMAVVSADLRMAFDPRQVPVADRAELDHAVWFAHHLPYNVDRYAIPLDSVLVARKRDLLAKIAGSRDRTARAGWFADLHRINHQLATEHTELITAAGAVLDRARAGVLNRATAMRRDWCFALYPPESLHEQRREIERQMSEIERTVVTTPETTRATS